eukprot:2077674-Prymnesium_polylepis.2
MAAIRECIRSSIARSTSFVGLSVCFGSLVIGASLYVGLTEAAKILAKGVDGARRRRSSSGASRVLFSDSERQDAGVGAAHAAIEELEMQRCAGKEGQRDHVDEGTQQAYVPYDEEGGGETRTPQGVAYVDERESDA